MFHFILKRKISFKNPWSLSLSDPIKNCLTLTFLKAPQNWKFELACVEESGSYLSLGRLLADPRRCWAARQTGGESKVLKVDSKVVSKVDSKAYMEFKVSKVMWTHQYQVGSLL